MLPHRVLLPRLSAPQRAHASRMGEQRAGWRTYRGRHSEIRTTRCEFTRGRGHRVQQGIRVHSIGKWQIHRREFSIRWEQGEEPILEYIGLWVVLCAFLWFPDQRDLFVGKSLFPSKSVWFRQLHTAPVFLPAAHRRPSSIFNQVSLSPSRYIARFNFISCNRVVESTLSLAQWRSSTLFNRLIRSNGTFPFFSRFPLLRRYQRSSARSSSSM